MKTIIILLLSTVTLYAQTDTIRANTDTAKIEYELKQYQDYPGHFTLYSVPKQEYYRGKIVWPPDTTKRRKKMQP